MSDLPCRACLARTWLLTRLAGHLDQVRDRTESVLELTDEELICAVAGRDAAAVREELAAFDAGAARRRCADAALTAICRCDPAYPSRLRDLPAPPAVLHVAGDPARLPALTGGEPVAIIGARRTSPYGRDVAHWLARSLGATGVTVVSGMASGVDGAAHEGALSATAGTVAVLAAGAERAYPVSARGLHRRIRATGVVVSELGPGVAVRRWMFPARNRLIAALSAMTVVVSAREGSGALLTARVASELGRVVGAVPGQITAPLSRGPHRLLRGGATLVTGPADVLDALYGAAEAGEGPGPPALAPGPPALGPGPPALGPGPPALAPGPPALAPGGAAAPGHGRQRVLPGPPVLEPALQRLLDAIADGHDPAEAFTLAGFDPDRGLAALTALELGGRIARGPGGRFTARP